MNYLKRHPEAVVLWPVIGFVALINWPWAIAFIITTVVIVALELMPSTPG